MQHRIPFNCSAGWVDEYGIPFCFSRYLNNVITEMNIVPFNLNILCTFTGILFNIQSLSLLKLLFFAPDV
jgi:hypothetical protein